MNTLGKTIATVFMWIILGAIGMSGILADPGLGGTESAIIAIGAMLAGIIGTGMIWSPEVFNGSSHDESKQTHTEKAKRQAGDQRMALLLEMMDEDEREAFKETLKRRVLNGARFSEDGELPYGADMLYEDEREKRLRG